MNNFIFTNLLVAFCSSSCLFGIMIIHLTSCKSEVNSNSKGTIPVTINEILKQGDIHPMCDSLEDWQLFAVIDSLIDHFQDTNVYRFSDFTNVGIYDSTIPKVFVPSGVAVNLLILRMVDYIEFKRNRYCGHVSSLYRLINGKEIEFQAYCSQAMANAVVYRDWLNNTKMMNTRNRIMEWHTKYKDRIEVIPPTCID